MDLRRCRVLRTMGQVMVIRKVKMLYLLILKETEGNIHAYCKL